jgi:hypothetical protein
MWRGAIATIVDRDNWETRLVVASISGPSCPLADAGVGVPKQKRADSSKRVNLGPASH